MNRTIKHGHARNDAATPTYTTWKHMVRRCTYPREPGYENYGGRGITVCARWRSFENFLADMGERPAGKFIDRIDSDGHYEPWNCRWATRVEQNRNTSQNVEVTFNGRTQCITAWEQELGTKPGTIYTRLRRGWSTERALTAPVQGRTA